jgi:hypothetical protein
VKIDSGNNFLLAVCPLILNIQSVLSQGMHFLPFDAFLWLLLIICGIDCVLYLCLWFADLHGFLYSCSFLCETSGHFRTTELILTIRILATVLWGFIAMMDSALQI